MLEQLEIKSLAQGLNFEGFLLVRQSEQRVSNNGNNYLDMTLVDRSGEINAKFWDQGHFLPEPGSIIKVRSNIILFNNRLQMRISKFREATDQDNINISLLTPCAPYKPEHMLDTIHNVINDIKQKDIKKTLHFLITKYKEQLMFFPAAQKLHHAERSGLLHHITSMLKTADALLSAYPWLNADLIRAGVILHDLSKIEELESDKYGNVKDYTKDGLLIGHLVRGVASLRKAAEEVDASQEVILLLEHMILSHHGEAEFGSPRKPMFPEAEILHFIDVIDARMNEMKGILERIPEGSFSERIWSLDRRLYHPLYSEINHE